MFQGVSAVRNNTLQFKTEKLWRFMPFIETSGLTHSWCQNGRLDELLVYSSQAFPWLLDFMLRHDEHFTPSEELEIYTVKAFLHLSLLYSSRSVEKYKY